MRDRNDTRRDRDDGRDQRRADQIREDERRGDGHAFTEHRDVSLEQLDRRVLTQVNARGIKEERQVRDATRFCRSDGDLLRCADAVWNSAELREMKQRQEALYHAGRTDRPKIFGEAALRDALGPDWRSRVDGRSLAADGRTRTTSFGDDATCFARWGLGDDGHWRLVTCFPKTGSQR
ncbi:hypothetical protein FXF51_46735 [Nonomuraea sp. PA05]|uniref:hypothetical protein n=1 Tax=Nonomuraea sp. PA05 TaxID=2604466 RepID=UPI0011D44C4C|nr:hypothetical protein [Nonomuraea sp. PA05]TYB54742.1 hypothetical protein FXF51_46735 [Nonomuraea sp. PA05]